MSRPPHLRIARALSILGHPALLMPVAVPLAAAGQGAPRALVLQAGAAALGVALAVGAYSAAQVRAGRWQHVDASQPAERRQLNLFLVGLLGLAALGLWWATGQALLGAGLGLGAAIVAVALGLRRRLKTSLHGAFVAYAAALAWPVPGAGLALGLLGLGVGWSRLVLGRHSRAEVLTGWALGAAAGVTFAFLVGQRPLG